MFENGEQDRMTCMEVWGGNVQTEKQFETTGLDVWVSSQPEGESQAGGDVYYVSSCASGRITRLMLADVSGHGQTVADIASRLRDLMRDNVNTIGHRPFVAAMNKTFADETDGHRFATAIVSSYFAPTRSLSICSAGHPPPLTFRAAKQAWNILDTTPSARRDPGTEVSDLPFGIISDTQYSECTLKLENGDMVLCYTDAFSESQGADGKMLGIDGLLAVVSSCHSADPERVLSHTIESLRSCSPTDLNQDDATLLLFRANGLRSTLSDNLMAPFRLLRSAADQSRILPP